MNWAEWLLMAFAGFVAVLAFCFVVFCVLCWWWNREFCEDDE